MSVQELFDLTGRVALITGGSRGLGFQIAEAYAEQGAKLVLTARKAAQLEEASESLREQGAEVLALPSDLSQPGAPAQLVQQVMDEWGQIDILVNNAGTTWGAPAEDYPLEAWHKVLNLNLTAAFTLSQAVAVTSMIPRKAGRIVNVTSVAGLRGNRPPMAGTAAYNASKGGLISLTWALAAEWAKYGITVNAIAPGFFPTKMTQGTLEAGQDLIEAATPLGRVGGPEDLKGVAVLLGSDASGFMTGQVVVVDGGMSVI